MVGTGPYIRGYVLAAVMGAIGGGLVATLAITAIPGMISQMMQNMVAHMRQGGLSLAEMRQRTTTGFGEVREKETQCE